METKNNDEAVVFFVFQPVTDNLIEYIKTVSGDRQTLVVLDARLDMNMELNREWIADHVTVFYPVLHPQLKRSRGPTDDIDAAVADDVSRMFKRVEEFAICKFKLFIATSLSYCGTYAIGEVSEHINRHPGITLRGIRISAPSGPLFDHTRKVYPVHASIEIAIDNAAYRPYEITLQQQINIVHRFERKTIVRQPTPEELAQRREIREAIDAQRNYLLRNGEVPDF